MGDRPHPLVGLTTSLAAMVLAMLVAGCARHNPTSHNSAQNVFRVPLDISLVSLDPALVSDTWSIGALSNTFEGLVIMGEDNQVHPCLATSWKISDDGRSYTFDLRHDVLFQNGRRFDADDVKASLERACSNGLDAPLASEFLNDIVGMKGFHDGKAKTLAGVKVLDASTIEISIDAPRPYFLAKLSLPAATIVDTRAIKDGIHIRSVAEMVGTGPFKVDSYIEDQLLVQTAFAKYHGGRPEVDRIERPVMRDAAERLAAFKRGEIDTIQQLGRSDYAELSKDPKYKDMLQLIPRATLVCMALNTASFPDRRVRQAVAMAVDRDLIANDYLFGTVGSARGILPTGIPGHRDDPSWLPPNLVRARELLAASGHPNGTGLPDMRISFAMENPDIERIADQIGSQLRTKLGIHVQLDKMESATLITRQNRKDLACEVSGWFADYMDPQDFLSILLTSDSPENHWNCNNREFDAICREADSCMIPNRRFALYAKAEDIALQDAAIIPICYWKTPIITNPRVHGIQTDAANFLPYNSVRIERQ